MTATEGLFSPSTGIIDSHQYMLALLGDLTLVKNSEVAAVRRARQWLVAGQSTMTAKRWF